jgi:hypothetical protein
MQKPFDQMTLRDLMDKLDELRFESLRQREKQRKESHEANHLLSREDLAKFLGTESAERFLDGKEAGFPVYFRKINLRV